LAEALRLPAEQRYPAELAALKANDKDPRPPGWNLSPRMVETFILGSQGKEFSYQDGKETRTTAISKKFYGDDILVQRAIVTLASDRGLLLVGEPGTAKSWLSEHLSAAVCGNSLLTIQGSAGITEDQIKYSWNYALLLAKGPCPEALVPGPLYIGMRDGMLVRFEEITRTPHEVQDTLLSSMSDKVMIVPELGDAGVVLARRGFNIIGTANTRDRGVNEMSSALKRRFNFETVMPVEDLHEEINIVRSQVTSMLAGTPADKTKITDQVLELLVTTFHEIRQGHTLDGVKIDRGSGVMSTAEAVSVGLHSALFASFFGKGAVDPEHVVINMAGAVVKENKDDIKILQNYWEVAVKPRANKEIGLWKAYYKARNYLKLPPRGPCPARRPPPPPRPPRLSTPPRPRTPPPRTPLRPRTLPSPRRRARAQTRTRLPPSPPRRKPPPRTTSPPRNRGPGRRRNPPRSRQKPWRRPRGRARRRRRPQKRPRRRRRARKRRRRRPRRSGGRRRRWTRRRSISRSWSSG
jgi:MoxR-like ATPase